MKKVWFKAKDYGWGWYPATWEGWAVMLAYFGLLAAWYFFIFRDLFKNADTDPDGVGPALGRFFIGTALLTVTMILVAYRTGEKPEWRWGSKKKDAPPTQPNDSSQIQR